MTWGRCGLLLLQRNGLSPSIPCRFYRRTSKIKCTSISAALVLTPGTPLGLLTNAVQTLAGVLLPGATVFLLLLCNDKAVLGPWVNTLKVNLFTGAVVVVLVMLSVILTASVLFPDITGNLILSVLALVETMAILQWQQRRRGVTPVAVPAVPLSERATWRMPRLSELPRPELTTLNLAFLTVLRGYLFIAGGH